eukprot:2630554-Prymnesium_polylepis.1
MPRAEAAHPSGVTTTRHHVRWLKSAPSPSSVAQKVVRGRLGKGPHPVPPEKPRDQGARWNACCPAIPSPR